MTERDHPRLSLTGQCRLLALSRSTLYYQPTGHSAETLALMRCITADPRARPRPYFVSPSFTPMFETTVDVLPYAGSLGIVPPCSVNGR